MNKIKSIYCLAQLNGSPTSFVLLKSLSLRLHLLKILLSKLSPCCSTNELTSLIETKTKMPKQ